MRRKKLFELKGAKGVSGRPSTTLEVGFYSDGGFWWEHLCIYAFVFPRSPASKAAVRSRRRLGRRLPHQSNGTEKPLSLSLTFWKGVKSGSKVAPE